MKKEFMIPEMKISKFDIDVHTSGGSIVPPVDIEDSNTVGTARTSLGTAEENTTLFVF